MVSPLLRGAVFRRYWLGQTISMFGDQISLFAVPVTAVVLLHAHATQMGLLTAAGLVPSLLLSLYAGAFADRRSNRRLIMIVSDIARALLMGSIPVAYALGTLHMPQLYVVAFVVGTFDVFFNVCAASMFNVVTDSKYYVEGQSLLNGSRAASDVFGQSSAGLLIAGLTAAGAIVFDAASFLLSAFFLGRIHPQEPRLDPTDTGHVSAGLRFIRNSAVMRTAL